jgi:hypothetical protein
MRIPDEWQNNSIYLYPSEHDAYEGTRAGGSGFLLGFDSDRIPGRQMVYAVTNAHVIEGGNCTIRLNRHDSTVRYRRFAKAKNVSLNLNVIIHGSVQFFHSEKSPLILLGHSRDPTALSGAIK